MARIQPLGDRILLQIDEQQGEQKRGGIIVLTGAQDKPTEGTVVATGKGWMTPEGRLIPLDVKPGDKVIFGKFAGAEVVIDDEKYLLVTQGDILGILN